MGNPIHDGKKPIKSRDIEGIRVDGEVLEFVDETIPEKVERYLVESKKLWRHRIANDCVAFVALANSIELRNIKQNPFRQFDASLSLRSIDDQLANDAPLVLTRGFHDEVRIPVHTVLPAHLTTEPNYLHKLGDHGPLCMSSLEDAKQIFGCNGAHPAHTKEL
jgi:hypothetical protein